MTFVLECIIACVLFTIVIKAASAGRREAFDRSAVQFHALASPRGMVIGLPFALFVGFLVALI